MDIGLGEEPGPSRDESKGEDDYQFEVLSTEQIVQHMVECIKEVNTVIQVSFGIQRFENKCLTWDFLCLDSDHDSPDFAQSLQVGQGEAYGALLLGRAGGHVRRGQGKIVYIFGAKRVLFTFSFCCRLSHPLEN